MTDPKLVEKAREVAMACSEPKEEWVMETFYEAAIDKSSQIIAQALQAHGEEVRRNTLEECLELVKSKKCDDRNNCCKFIRRKLLEVK